MDALVDPVLIDLKERRIYVVADDDEIPTEAVEYLAVIVANAVASDFSKPTDVNAIAWAEAKLRHLSASRPTYEPMYATYY